MNIGTKKAPLLFYSYAREDKRHLASLRKNLALLKREGKISDWYDGEIRPGDPWNPAIREQLERARIILFLVSLNRSGGLRFAY
jgi:hypothetical protein